MLRLRLAAAPLVAPPLLWLGGQLPTAVMCAVGGVQACLWQQLVPDRGPVAAKAREVDDVTRRPRAFGDPLCQPRVQVAQAAPVATGSSDRR